MIGRGWNVFKDVLYLLRPLIGRRRRELFKRLIHMQRLMLVNKFYTSVRTGVEQWIGGD